MDCYGVTVTVWHQPSMFDTANAPELTGLAGKYDADLPELGGQRGIEDRFELRLGHADKLLGLQREGRLCRDQVCSAAAAAGAAVALDFFRLLTMIVISGTSSSGRALFSGCWTMPKNCDCTALASSCSASTAEP